MDRVCFRFKGAHVTDQYSSHLVCCRAGLRYKMKLLIIGGTRFLGRHLLTAALARDHEVTLFNRGNFPAEPGVETIHGDRHNDGDLVKLRHRRWDVVIDTCGHLPRSVRSAAEILSGSV